MYESLLSNVSRGSPVYGANPISFSDSIPMHMHAGTHITQSVELVSIFYSSKYFLHVNKVKSVKRYEI